MKLIKKICLISLIVIMALTSLVGCAPSENNSENNDLEEDSNYEAEGEAEGEVEGEELKIAENMTWSTVSIGSATYTQAAAIADALTTRTGSKIRLTPSDTSVGRILGIVNGDVDYGIGADEAYFGTMGLYDFSSYDIGPKTGIRAVLARPGQTTACTKKSSNIKTPYDLKGTRLVWLPGFTSVNIKSVALLAFGDLTLDDVELVIAPSYSAGAELVINGDADWIIGQVYASYWYELEAQGEEVKFVETPADDKEGWDRLQEVTPWLYPGVQNDGPGVKEPFDMPFYVNPLFLTTEDKSVDEVYALVKAMDESYDLYKDTDSLSHLWAVEEASGYPIQCPYHEGSVKYFKELGLWTDEHEEWNNNYLKETKVVEEKWPEFIEKAKEDGVKEEDLHNKWINVLEEELGKSFPENLN